MKKLKGFTLTELMIALAVLGILVAVVTPAIMKTRPDRNKMMVKKAYYVVENIVSNLINNPALYPDNTDNCFTGSAPTADSPCYWGFEDIRGVRYNGDTHFRPTPTSGQIEISGDNKFPILFLEQLNRKAFTHDDGLMASITTNDGITWIFYPETGQPAWPAVTADHMAGVTWRKAANAGTSPNVALGGADHTMAFSGKKILLIDVNGVNNGPNCCQATSNASVCAACADPTDFDRFRIWISPDGRLEIDPSDALASDYVTINARVRD